MNLNGVKRYLEGGSADQEDKDILANKNQGTNLLNPSDYTLYRIKYIIKDLNNFELWLKLTILVLILLNLDRLINLSLLRPTKTNLEGTKQSQNSRQVRNQIVDNLSIDLYRQVISQTDKEPKFANSFIKAIKDLFQKSSTISTIEYHKEQNKATLRETYDSNLNFIRSANRIFYRIRELKIPISLQQQLYQITN